MVKLLVLREGMRLLGLELSAELEHRFHRYQEGLAQWNQRVNLTSKAALADAERVHFLDSLALVPLLQREMPDALSMVDVGAGAGFPSVPMKLFVPRLHLTLVEATSKKADFLSWLVMELELQNVNVVAQRAETLAHDSRYRESFDVATARALGPLATVLELTLPFCRIGGVAVMPRAGDVAGEVAAATAVAQELGGLLQPPELVQVSTLRKDSAVVLVDKVALTNTRYPRRAGLPARRPMRNDTHDG